MSVLPPKATSISSGSTWGQAPADQARDPVLLEVPSHKTTGNEQRTYLREMSNIAEGDRESMSGTGGWTAPEAEGGVQVLKAVLADLPEEVRLVQRPEELRSRKRVEMTWELTHSNVPCPG